MIKKVNKNEVRQKRHQRIRNKISGTASRPRMAVYRSLNNIFTCINFRSCISLTIVNIKCYSNFTITATIFWIITTINIISNNESFSF